MMEFVIRSMVVAEVGVGTWEIRKEITGILFVLRLAHSPQQYKVLSNIC